MATKINHMDKNSNSNQLAKLKSSWSKSLIAKSEWSDKVKFVKTIMIK